MWVSHVGGRNPSTWAITCCVLGCALAGNWNWEHPDMGRGYLKWHLTHHSKHPPRLYLLRCTQKHLQKKWYGVWGWLQNNPWGKRTRDGSFKDTRAGITLQSGSRSMKVHYADLWNLAKKKKSLINKSLLRCTLSKNHLHLLNRLLHISIWLICILIIYFIKYSIFIITT